jgi:hypothetical protein
MSLISRGLARLRVFGLRRAFWLLMLLAHAPALLGAWRESGRFAGFIVLALSIAFFALKIRDVAWLRFRADRRSWMSICVLVALLHANVLQSENHPIALSEYTALAATTWLVVRVPAVRRALLRISTRVSATGRRLACGPVTGATIWLDVFRPHCWVLAFRCFGLRAPPV